MSTKLTLAFFEPLDCGAKFTCRMQLEPIATVPPTVGQVVPDGAMPKAAASVPVNVTCESVSAALPTFRSVIACGPLVLPIASVPNVREDGERLAIGAAATPVPERAITCVAPASPPELSITSISAW